MHIVPQDKKTNAITNTQRIEAAMPTIVYCLENGCKAVVLMSHLGRPDGHRVEKASLKPVVEVLNALLPKLSPKHAPKNGVIFVDDCVGDKVEAICASPEHGSVILLENLRFHAEEEGSSVHPETKEKKKADPESVKKFRESLTKLGDIYEIGRAHV